MTATLLAMVGAILAVVVIGGAIAAASVRDQRAVILGLLIAQVGSPFLADPLPDPRGTVARIAGAALAAYLLLIATRGAADEPRPAALSWPAAALTAVTAALVVVVAGGGPIETTPAAPVGSAAPYLPAAAAGTALLVLAAAPIVLSGTPFRVAIGLLLAVTGVALVSASIGGPPSALTDLCLAVLLGALAGAGGLLTRIARQPRTQPARR